eukprot:1374544-Pleurochrysis_carterae.AAC.2
MVSGWRKDEKRMCVCACVLASVRTCASQAMVRRSLESDNRALAMRASSMKKQLDAITKERDSMTTELEKWRTGQARRTHARTHTRTHTRTCVHAR